MDFNNEFSIYDCPKVGFNFEDNVNIINDTAASFGVTYDSKTVSKKKRGTDWKDKVKIVGAEIKLSIHLPINLRRKLYGLARDGYKDSAGAYGPGSKHPYFSLPLILEDEDGNQCLKYYPKCIVTSTLPDDLKSANADSIDEVELTIKAQKHDSYKDIMYEQFVEESDTELVDSWFTSFSEDLCKDDTNQEDKNA